MQLAKCTGLFAFACCAISVHAQQTEAIAGIERTQVQSFATGWLSKQIERTGAPGALIVVIDRGGHRWEHGIGFANIARSVPMDPQKHLFRIASETKVFTALAVLQLKERNTLSLDDDVESHLAGLALQPRLARPILVRNLLQHTGGVSNIPMIGAARGSLDPHVPLSQYLARSAPRRLREPGVVAAYTNGSYTLLGRIIETASGLPYETFIRDNLFRPLEMSERARFDSAGLQPQDMAEGSLLRAGKPRPFPIRGTNTAPSGDALLTAHDMGNFLLMLLNNGQFSGRTIVSQAGAYDLFHDCFSADPRQSGVCLGPKRGRYGTIDYFAHGGDYIAYKSAWWVIPELDLAMWVGTNSDAEFSAEFLGAFLDHFFPQKAVERSVPIVREPSRPGADWDGTYRINSSTMSNSGRFFDLLDPEADLHIRAVQRNGIELDGLRYESVGANAYGLALTPGNRSSTEAPPKILKFIRSANGDATYVQLDLRSATRIPNYLRADWNLRAALCVLILLIIAGVTCAVLLARTPRVDWKYLALAAGFGAMLCWVAGVACFAAMANAGPVILFGFPKLFYMARTLFVLACLLSTIALIRLLALRPYTGHPATIAIAWLGIGSTALAAWLIYWQIL